MDQIDGVISQLSDEQYCRVLPVLNASIGQHVRHTLEFFICLIEAKNKEVLSYDSRRRDTYIEQEITSARNIIRSIKTFLSNNEPDRSLKMEVDYEIHPKDSISIPSTFYRELAYNIEHAVHHMALIKIGVHTTYDWVKLPNHFGVASSTVRYQKQQKTE